MESGMSHGDRGEEDNIYFLGKSRYAEEKGWAYWM